MRRVVCPGAFDPVTNGHIDIIRRAAKQNEEVIVAVLVNVNNRGLFTADEKLEMLREATKEFDNVTVAKFDGLLVDFCRAHDVSAIVRSLRSVSDFDYELQMAQMNRSLAGVETVFMPTNPEWSYLSSSLVREVARLGGEYRGLVPEHVAAALEERLG